MPQMEYNDDVIAKIREGKSPLELEKEQQEEQAPQGDKRVEAARPNKYEKLARNDGWVPLEDWVEQGKSEDDWVEAAEFVRRGELMTRIKGQSKALKGYEKKMAEMEERIKAVTEHNKKIAQVEFERAKKMLRQKKIEAMEEHDHEAVLEIEDKLEELEAKAQAEEAQETKTKEKETQVVDATLPEPLQEWLERDDSAWYRNDPILQAAADKLAAQYANHNWDPAVPAEDQPWDELLENVEETLRKRFPNEFKTLDGEVENEDYEEEEEVEETPKRKPVARKRASQVVEPGRAPTRNRGRGKSKLTIHDLSADERKAHDEFVHRQKMMTSEEYLEQLEAVRDL